jgi:hypothetical protein
MKIQTSQLNESIRHIPLPDNLRERPVSKQGFPVPYFAGFVNGEWDFRVVAPNRFPECVRYKRCWVCGLSMGSMFCFVAGPMCIVSKTSAEPPCHYSCAHYAAIACPFLANPRMKRNEKDLPEGHQPPAGTAIMRNPGVTAVLLTRKYNLFDDGSGGKLIRMGQPTRIEWYAHRRQATREEVMESIDSGMSLLVDACNNEDTPRDREDAHQLLAAQLKEALHFLPPAGGVVQD